MSNKKLSFDEFHERLVNDERYSCSCHTTPPCPLCDGTIAAKEYQYYLTEFEEENKNE